MAVSAIVKQPVRRASSSRIRSSLLEAGLNCRDANAPLRAQLRARAGCLSGGIACDRHARLLLRRRRAATRMLHGATGRHLRVAPRRGGISAVGPDRIHQEETSCAVTVVIAAIVLVLRESAGEIARRHIKAHRTPRSRQERSSNSHPEAQEVTSAGLTGADGKHRAHPRDRRLQPCAAAASTTIRSFGIRGPTRSDVTLQRTSITFPLRTINSRSRRRRHVQHTTTVTLFAGRLSVFDKTAADHQSTPRRHVL